MEQEKIIIPNQWFGIGDIIFEQTVVRNLLKEGDRVIWPVTSHFTEGLNRAYPDFLFIDMSVLRFPTEYMQEYEVNGMRVLPLRYADFILKVPYTQCMQAKYMLYNMDWQRWKDKAMWTRTLQKEKALFDALGLQEGERYNLINRFFSSDNSRTVNITVNNGLRNIEMQSYKEYSLFDWSLVIECAEEIHTVSTSIIYILELLQLHAQHVHLYTRKPEEHDFRNVDYLLTSHEYIRHL